MLDDAIFIKKHCYILLYGCQNRAEVVELDTGVIRGRYMGKKSLVKKWMGVEKQKIVGLLFGVI